MITMQFIAAVIAFAFTIALVPIVKTQCIRWRLFDAPGPLKIHSQPIPRLGGVALTLAIVAAALLSGPQRSLYAWSFFAALALVWAAGLADDLRGLSPWLRLAVQFVSGALLWQQGWRLPILGSGALNLVATCGFVAAFANAINLMDGMDGLAAGVVGIIAVAYVLLPSALMNPFALAIAGSLVGACAGFLLFNFPPPARLFMGDSGSTLLGFCLAFLSLDLYRSHATTRSTLLFPLLAASLPLLDAFLAMFRRLRNGNSVFTGDRLHCYDLLGNRGWSVHRIVFAFYGVTTVLAGIGLFSVRNGSPYSWALAVIIVGLLVFVAIRLGALRGDDRSNSAYLSNAQELEAGYGETSQTD